MIYFLGVQEELFVLELIYLPVKKLLIKALIQEVDLNLTLDEMLGVSLL